MVDNKITRDQMQGVMWYLPSISLFIEEYRKYKVIRRVDMVASSDTMISLLGLCWRHRISRGDGADKMLFRWAFTLHRKAGDEGNKEVPPIK